MKKKNAFILSAIALSIVAISTLLIIFGIKGQLAYFFSSSYGTFTIVGCTIWLIALIYLLLSDRIKKL